MPIRFPGRSFFSRIRNTGRRFGFRRKRQEASSPPSPSLRAPASVSHHDSFEIASDRPNTSPSEYRSERSHEHASDRPHSSRSELQPQRSRPCTPTARMFLQNLPIVVVDELPEDERRCHICHDPYLQGDEAEEPVRLPCGHHFGQACINRWLSPDDVEPKSTCPICRTSFFTVEYRSDSGLDENGNLEGEDVDARFSGNADSFVFGEWNFAQLPRTATEATRQMQHFDQHWSNQMLLVSHVRPYVPRQDPNARTAHEVLRSFRENVAPSYLEAVTLGDEMGQLFIRLRTTMRLLKFLPTWNEFGPLVEDILDAESRGMIETALCRLVHIEEAWAWAHQGA